MLVVLVTGAILALFGVAAAYFWTFRGAVSDSQATWGLFGDYMGGVLNPIFGLGALFALLYTIVLQVQELHETREEMRKTTDAARQSTFENTFFQMIRLHHQIVEGTQENITHWQGSGDFIDPEAVSTYVGREVFKRLAARWEDKLDFKKRYLPNVLNRAEIENERTGLDGQWALFLRDQYGTLGHYFRNLYTIIKYVHESKLEIDKKHYVNIVRAQLSIQEFFLLFYNCVMQRNAPFKHLIEEYEFFEHVYSGPGEPLESLHIPAEHYPLYEKRAYGDNAPVIFNEIERCNVPMAQQIAGPTLEERP
jgi:hypothetical protein